MNQKLFWLVWNHAPYKRRSLLVLLALTEVVNESAEGIIDLNKLAVRIREERAATWMVMRSLSERSAIEIIAVKDDKNGHPETVTFKILGLSK